MKKLLLALCILGPCLFGTNYCYADNAAKPFSMGAAPQFFDNDGLVLAGGHVHMWIVGTTTNKDSYTDETAGTPNSNPVNLDAYGYPDTGGGIWLVGTYKVQIADSENGTIKDIPSMEGLLSGGVEGETQSGEHVYAADGEASDAYVATYDPPITAYTEGMQLRVKASTANTGGATFDAGDGAKVINKQHGTALVTGDIEADEIITVVYDDDGSGTWEMIDDSIHDHTGTGDGGVLDVLTDVTTFTAAGDLDIGAHEFRALTLTSDATTGTAPLTVASITKVTNLNCDTVDGFEGFTFWGASAYEVDADQEIPNNTWTAITFSAEFYDTDNIHSTVSSTDRLTVPGNAVYGRLKGHIEWEADATGIREITINGSANNGLIVPVVERNPDATYPTGQYIFSGILDISGGGYFTLTVRQSSGGDLDALCDADGCWLELEILK